MRVLRESCKRVLQFPKAWRPTSSYQERNGGVTSYLPDQKGLAAIPTRTIPHSDWFITPNIYKYYFCEASKAKSKSNTLEKIRSSIPCRDSKRNLHQKVPQDEKKPIPRLLYVQNPIVWFSNKLDFRFLRVNWDPLFCEAEFTRGARQAVSTVTQLLSVNKYESMKPLLTKNALLNLRRDVEISWADEVKRNIGLAPQDVQLIIPRKLHFRQNAEPKLLERGYMATAAAIISTNKSISEKKFCDIDVLFIALKYMDTHRFQDTPLCFVDIVARFHRNYTDEVLPDWTISAFKVRRFNVIPQKQNA